MKKRILLKAIVIAILLLWGMKAVAQTINRPGSGNALNLIAIKLRNKILTLNPIRL